MSETNNTELETKIKLKHILGLSKCNHKIEILKEPNIKHAHIYCKINQLSQALGHSIFVTRKLLV